ncbi:MAG: MoaD/ThiS family protein [Hyphomicrobiaceae bacterium]|nr:MAG: MoaD/ThiS family protein [Hyphomicrobiaceae bacterium]
MPRVTFTANLQRHVELPTLTVCGATVREALEQVFALNPRARGYILDDQSSLRKHMAVFINGAPMRDRARLSDAVGESCEIFVMQALSGG